MRSRLGLIVGVGLVLPGCIGAPDPQPSTQTCTSTDSRVGQVGTFRTLFHGVSGTARIVDDCTISIEHFNYDGGGLDVRVYGGRDSTFRDAVILSSDLRRPGGYRDETLTVRLPDGVTLDDVRAIAIWCVVVDVNFGDAVFP